MAISLNNIDSLINDCKQAFQNPFRHPQTGSTEKISSFYAVTAGTIGPEAIQHYFNSLENTFGANIFLLQGRDIVTINRWATAGHRDRISALLSGLIIELNYNDKYIIMYTKNALEQLMNSTGGFPINEIRTNALSSFLCQPFCPDTEIIDFAIKYWHLATLCNKKINLVGQGIIPQTNRIELMRQTIEHLTQLTILGAELNKRLSIIYNTLGPLI